MRQLRVTPGGAWLAVLAAALAVAPMALSAQDDDERQRAVGDWLVADVVDDSGLRTLSITRDIDSSIVDYALRLPPDATAFQSQLFFVSRLGCGRSEAESLGGGLAGLQPDVVRTRLAGYLARCETPAGEAETLLGNFDRAFAQLTEWARDREYRASTASAEDAIGLEAGEATENMTAVAEESLDAAANAVEAAADAVEAAADSMENAADFDPPMDLNASEAIDPPSLG